MLGEQILTHVIIKVEDSTISICAFVNAHVYAQGINNIMHNFNWTF